MVEKGRVFAKVLSGQYKDGHLELIIGEAGHDSNVIINGIEIMCTKVVLTIEAGRPTWIDLTLSPSVNK